MPASTRRSCTSLSTSFDECVSWWTQSASSGILAEATPQGVGQLKGEHEQTFGDVLRGRRLGARLTQAALAERAGISTRGIQDIERGLRQPHRDTVHRLAEALRLGQEQQSEFRALATSTPRRPRASNRTRAASVDNRPVTQHNLPLQLTSFVGRVRELAEVRGLIEANRLVTLIGAGGIGKTRLALEVAAQLADRGAGLDGVWFVELAPTSDPQVVTESVAQQLNVSERAGQAPESSLSQFLGPKQLLLVLDNCEHLVQPCAELVEHLLRSCRGCRILATSRQPLGIAGEVTFLVPALGLPRPHSPAAELLDAEAVRLFADRVRTVHPAFQMSERNAAVAAQVCQRLEGVPLALELAAASVRVFTVDEIAARLDAHLALLSTTNRSAPARHQTLRDTLDWSYALLSQPERVLFEQLAVFAGGWTLEAAEAICGDNSNSVLDVLGRLVEKSLVVAEQSRTETRFRLLEMLRQYADERLHGRGTAFETQRRHARFFLALLEDAARAPMTGPASGSLERLHKEHANLRTALRWVIASGEFAWDQVYTQCVRAGDVSTRLNAYADARLQYEHALDALGHLPDSTDTRRRRIDTTIKLAEVAYLSEPEQHYSRLREAESLAETLRTAEGPGRDDALRLVRVQHMLGRLLFNRHEFGEAKRYYERVLVEAQKLGEPDLAALPAAALGQALMIQGWVSRAEPLLRQAVDSFQRTGNWFEWCRAVSFVGFCRAGRGDVVGGLNDGERALARAVETNNPTAVSLCHAYLAYVYWLGVGDPSDMLEEASAAVDVGQHSGDRVAVCAGFALRALALSRLGRHTEAVQSMTASEAVAKELGGTAIADMLLAIKAELALNAGDPAESAMLGARAIELADAAGGALVAGLAHRVRGRALAKLPEAPCHDVQHHLRSSVDLLDQTGLVVEAARSHLAWARIELARGDHNAAREHLEVAVDRFTRFKLDADLDAARELMLQIPTA
jgi:predicted ATPase/DNA-binding XRE family transcriptional regulator